MKKFFSEFKEFIMKGNIIDMAVGVVIGGAFKDIVNALVNNIINPLISLLTNGIALSDLKHVLKPEVLEKVDEAGNVIVKGEAEVAITYGVLIQKMIDFLIIALTIFVVIKIMMGMKKKLESLKKKQEEEASPAEPTTKVCPFCKSEIAIEATRCAHCTSELSE